MSPCCSWDYHLLRMQIDHIASAYAAKTDEELLQLASQLNELTLEAETALKTELGKRRIKGTELFTSRNPAGTEPSQPRAASESPLFASTAESSGLSAFVAEVLRIYHAQFWLFTKLVFPAVALGCIAIMLGRNESREIARNLPHGIEMLSHHTEITEMWIAMITGFFTSWTAFSFSYAAICVAVHQLAAGRVPSASECFAPVRARLGAFLRLSSLLFFFLLAGVGLTTLLETGLYSLLHRMSVHVNGVEVGLISWAFIGFIFLALSRFALSIPAVVLDNCRIGESLFRSDEFTERKWLILAVLLGKSLVGGYVAGLLPFWIASSLFATIPIPSWFPWVLTAASIAAVTPVEPPMFIGFAMLYLQRASSSSIPALNAQGASAP